LILKRGKLVFYVWNIEKNYWKLKVMAFNDKLTRYFVKRLTRFDWLKD
jgi:hypothetical protein